MLIARSIQEAGLYVELHPCDCGARSELTFSMIERDGELLAVYEGTCAGCGQARRFEFSIPREPVPGRAYGGEQPSSILDAGEFLWYSDRGADRAALAGDQRPSTRELSALDGALAALDEVVKFIPAGADAIPREAIHSEFGRAVYDANPDRFTRESLSYRRELLLDARAEG
ncbi:hypothetical protein [Streptomyces sp. SID13031]|uniref:hypothetical protein n=1 Tax=Streptomyces sp. SID13031 TaxID=2706046 RepID=UPI0013CD885A|nr:hypothetical protein [Streptomyces sp. SID13031]NEA32310.1 hypothetical protein [Streptomyces sp. SID13031]